MAEVIEEHGGCRWAVPRWTVRRWLSLPLKLRVAEFARILGVGACRMPTTCPRILDNFGDSRAKWNFEVLAGGSPDCAGIGRRLAAGVGCTRNVDHLLISTSDFSASEYVLLDKRKREARGPGGVVRIEVVPAQRRRRPQGRSHQGAA